jgi:prepilin-type N-terminal cleavage/methylation domain-containing protein
MSLKQKQNFQTQRGFTLIEVIVVVIVSMSLMAVAASWFKRQADTNLNSAVAAHLDSLTLAAVNYTNDHYDELASQAAGGTDVKLDIKNLFIANGYLDKDFTLKNNYMQSYTVSLKQEDNKILRLLVLSEGGEAIDDGSMREIANLTGGEAGFISTLANTKITGSQNAWSIDKPAAASVGHIATVNYLGQNSTVNASRFLSRVKVPGHPELNTMETDIEMDDNSLVFEDALTGTKAVLGSEKLKMETKVGEPNVEITSKWVKLPTYHYTGSLLGNSAYKFADDICEQKNGETLSDVIGRTFNIEFIQGSEKYIKKFTCGTPDGYEKGKGRAYLDVKLPSCKRNKFSNHGCIEYVSDGRRSFTENTYWFASSKHPYYYFSTAGIHSAAQEIEKGGYMGECVMFGNEEIYTNYCETTHADNDVPIEQLLIEQSIPSKIPVGEYCDSRKTDNQAKMITVDTTPTSIAFGGGCEYIKAQTLHKTHTLNEDGVPLVIDRSTSDD